MDFQIVLTGRHGLTRQIYRQMRGAILAGRLRAAERLPSTRSLAGQIAVARKTVTQAYELLYSESPVIGGPGSGERMWRRMWSVRNRIAHSPDPCCAAAPYGETLAIRTRLD